MNCFRILLPGRNASKKMVIIPSSMERKVLFRPDSMEKPPLPTTLRSIFSINPDFGQVEADPSEVNLSAFESYFSERRPFFVEGKNIYQFEPSNSIVIHNMGADNLFYSRRIGRSPHNSPELADKEYADIPEASTILGAMKLSGKTKERFVDWRS